MSQTDSILERQYVYRQRFVVEIIWATAASHDAFDDAMFDALASITADGSMIIWRSAGGPVERMGSDPSMGSA